MNLTSIFFFWANRHKIKVRVNFTQLLTSVCAKNFVFVIGKHYKYALHSTVLVKMISWNWGQHCPLGAWWETAREWLSFRIFIWRASTLILLKSVTQKQLSTLISSFFILQFLTISISQRIVSRATFLEAAWYKL